MSPADPSLTRLLAATAGRLADAGVTADTLLPLTGHGELAAGLAEALPMPDRTTGWRVVRGLLDGFAEAGPTPSSWRDARGERAMDIGIVLAASAIGAVFGWRGQQDGRLVHNIMPTRGCEQLQVGASSAAQLAWHSEDAFHPSRANLLLLACVRNPDEVGSLVSSVRRINLSTHDIELLGRPNVVILPDDSYPADWRAGPELTGVATVWPGSDGLCLRYDPSYSRFLHDSKEFHAAYDRLGAAIDAAGQPVPLARGDILLVDNDIAVHGRVPFQPRYDGTDRWLKRVLVHLPGRARPASEDVERGFDQELVQPTRGAEVFR